MLTLSPLRSAPMGLAAWRTASTEHFVALEVHPLCPPEDFIGRTQRIKCGSLSVFRLETSPSIVARTPQLIARDPEDSELIKVMLQVEGDAFIEQDGRVALLHPGDLVLYDTSRPYTLRFDSPCRIVVVSFPHRHLDVPREELSRITATAFPHELPLGGVVNPFLLALAQSLKELTADDRERLAQTALDLLTTVVSGELRHRGQGDPRRELRHRILASIEEMLPDPELSPSQVAERHFMSTRHLHAVFEGQGVTVGGWIRQRRLEHIRRELADPLNADVPLGRIAASWGLLNAAHFSRLFRATFGMSPSEYRRTRGLDGS